MKTDRELDAEVAEKVMGWLWELDNNGLQHLLSPQATTENLVLMPHYSTQIADAWLVVEKLRKDGFYICLMNDGHGGRVWLSMHSENEGTWDRGGQSDRLVAEIDYTDTAPLAICLAALKVVEGSRQ